jgi:hypothetical protein
MSPILASINSTAGVVLAAVLNNFWLALAVVALVWMALKLSTHARIWGSTQPPGTRSGGQSWA